MSWNEPHPNKSLGLEKPWFYGSAGNIGGVPNDVVFARRQRQRMNAVAVCACFFMPWMTFCLVYWVTGFSLHYNRPTLSWLVVYCFGAIALCIGVPALGSIRSKMKTEASHEPTWHIFLFITMIIAVGSGATLGNMNYHSFMQKYYDYVNLNDYNYVNVAETQGVQLMDGGRVNFSEGTVLDLTKAMGFKNLNSYCVAPITVTTSDNTRAQLANYDFWAVGMDCCSSDMNDFHCGEYNNPKARGGLRLLQDEERPFYRLAVQQAEALYHIKAPHPLFFYWTAEPVQEMESWKDEGYKFFFLGMLVHFFWQLLCVVLGVVGFGKMGHY